MAPLAAGLPGSSGEALLRPEDSAWPPDSRDLPASGSSTAAPQSSLPPLCSGFSVSHLQLVPTVRSAAFDGPLDLLLFLVKRDGVDLREIPIAPIADAYLEQVEALQQLDLDAAAEFVAMASTLCWLKSLELLPPVPGSKADDEARHIRADLSRRLFEYQRYRDAAEQLQARPMLGRDVFDRPAEPIAGYERPVYAEDDAFGLLERFYRMLQRNAAPAPVHEVTREVWTLEDAGRGLLAELENGPRDLVEVLASLPERYQRVFTVLATLEMARLGMVHLAQDAHLGPIVVSLAVAADAVELERLEGVVA